MSEDAWKRLKLFVENNLRDAEIQIKNETDQFCKQSKAVGRRGAFREVLLTMGGLEK